MHSAQNHTVFASQQAPTAASAPAHREYQTHSASGSTHQVITNPLVAASGEFINPAISCVSASLREDLEPDNPIVLALINLINRNGEIAQHQQMLYEYANANLETGREIQRRINREAPPGEREGYYQVLNL